MEKEETKKKKIKTGRKRRKEGRKKGPGGGKEGKDRRVREVRGARLRVSHLGGRKRGSGHTVTSHG